jgi:ABC-type uncharacterized transport system permease subunit
MTRLFLSIALHAYALAAVAYLVHLVRQMSALALVGRLAVAAGLALHGAALLIQVTEQGGMTVGMSQGLSLLAFLLLAIFLAIDLIYRRAVIGAFVTPLALAVLLPAFMVPSADGPILEAVRRPLLPVHVAIAILGVATFAVAAGVGLMYVLMERQVKLKRFGLLFARLPPLQVLDELNRALVLLGFIALSITLCTGALFDSQGGSWQWEPKRVATVIGWTVFAVLLSARFFAGWRGKRVAVVTMAGFGILLISFLSSYDPSALAGLR